MDVTVIILTKNEEIHIRRCLQLLKPLDPARIVLIDCDSTDATQQIAREMGAEVIVHQWPGNQAEQFNWALDNLDITTEWILRLDADEYLSDELVNELHSVVPVLPGSISALLFPLGRVFMERKLRHGIVNGVSMVRMFRNGAARYERRIMDEHLNILHGGTHICKHCFYDHSLLPLSDFITKHNNYANREAALYFEAELGLTGNLDTNSHHASAVERKRRQKGWYNKMPLLLRPMAYFCYRYILKLGFLDGKEGFMWDFFQGWWYRTLVDAKILEIKSAAGGDPEKIRQLLARSYDVHL